jgi:TolA-binding protein
MTEPEGRAHELAAEGARLRARVQQTEVRREQLRSTLEETAHAVAETELQLAETLERLADDRPEAAERLRGRAQAARDFAASEAGPLDDQPPGGRAP